MVDEIRTDDSETGDSAPNIFADFLQMPAEAMAKMFTPFLPGSDSAPTGLEDMAQWSTLAQRLQDMWTAFQKEQMAQPSGPPALLTDPAQWMALATSWYQKMPLAKPETQKRLWADGLELWEGILGQYGIGPKADDATEGKLKLPFTDRRFSNPKWSEQPLFALVHQTYLMLTEQVTAMVDTVDGIEPEKREQLRFATRILTDALSPAHFPLTNPVVLERMVETRGENLIRGMEHLIADLKRGQLTHTDPDAFRLGENIAVTPGKVVHETPLYQLIQYSPTTESVLATPLVIFPPWINRFYILDLNAKKSFVRWAVAQGITVFMVSWKSADASLADATMDDYVRAQIDAIDTVRARLKVPSVHTVGYCVAGTTLAATLAVLARRGESDKVKSVTFFTAQVDFEKAGELKNFVDDQQLTAIGQLSPEGYLDGRYLAATFNLLRGNDLIWSYVINNYLLGEDYTAFDLLHWNGDTTNLPGKWHLNYLRDLYRDNRLIAPDSLRADKTPIDLTRVTTPAYIQAGREDHIAPPESVWRITRHLRGPWEFVLAGSGHIAGVVNPPEAKKYQFWTTDAPASSYDEFLANAKETPGSWWPHWAAWLRGRDDAEIPASGKRKPGSKGDKVIEDAPGRYVRMP